MVISIECSHFWTNHHAIEFVALMFENKDDKAQMVPYLRNTSSILLAATFANSYRRQPLLFSLGVSNLHLLRRYLRGDLRTPTSYPASGATRSTPQGTTHHGITFASLGALMIGPATALKLALFTKQNDKIGSRKQSVCKSTLIFGDTC